MKKATLACLKSALIACLLAILWAGLASAEHYDADQIADAIYKAEGGIKAKKPYGILSVPCHSEKECRKICINTILNNFTRWQANGAKGDFIEFLGGRYAPVGATNDPKGLNRNWVRLVRYFMGKGKGK